MPNLLDIIQSIQIPALIKDEFIRTGEPYLDARNRPIHYVGGFAVVFPFKIGSEKWAFRCWSADLGNIERRLKIISKTIEDTKLPFFCNFVYEPEGIIVSGRSYPTTRRKWIDGINIKEYICLHYKNKGKMEELANSFLTLCNELHANHIAHGDLQHANILVDENGKLFLIDYDSFFVPDLINESDIISGLPDYQHPARKQNQIASEKLDYFSELVVYASIIAISERPELVEEYDLENNDRLLFSKEDYLDFHNSLIYSQLNDLGGLCELLTLVFDNYLEEKVDINNLEPFNVCLNKLSKQPIIHNFSSSKEIAYRGEEIILSWEIEDASIVELNGLKISVPTRSYTAKIEKDTDFILRIKNGLNEVCEINTVKVVQIPEFIFKLSRLKIKKDKNESVLIRWNVRNSTNVILYEDDTVLSSEISGEITVFPKNTTVYKISAVGLDGIKRFEKKTKVFVIPESEVLFTADKEYSFPSVPVQLSWMVKNFKSVELLGFGHQKSHGSIVVEPTEESKYELQVCDSFGKKSYFVHIKMLPVPIIESIMVPTPNFNINANIAYSPCVLSAKVNLPQTSFVELKSPVVSLNNIPDNSIQVVSKPKYVSLNTTNEHLWNKVMKIIKNSKIQIQQLLWKKKQ